MLNHIREFIHMGGYGAYVWTAYASSFFIILFHIYRALKNKNKVLHNEGTS